MIGHWLTIGDRILSESMENRLRPNVQNFTSPSPMESVLDMDFFLIIIDKKKNPGNLELAQINYQWYGKIFPSLNHKVDSNALTH